MIERSFQISFKFFLLGPHWLVKNGIAQCPIGAVNLENLLECKM